MKDVSTMEEVSNEEGSIYSNFDHKLNTPLVQELVVKEGKAYSLHPAQNFCGYIWFENGKFHEQIWQYRSLIEELEDEDIQALIDEANSRYGYD